MRKTIKLFSIITVIVMVMYMAIPTIITAGEIVPVGNMNNTDVVINIYEGRNTNDFSVIENKCMLYLFDMYRITMRNSNGAYIYCNSNQKPLFATIQDPNDEENRIISVAPNITSEDNIYIEPDKDFFISIQDFGSSDAVPKSIKLNFTDAPQGEEVIITITDGMDAAQMTGLENACMTYLFQTDVLKYRDDKVTMYNPKNNKDLFYFDSVESSIIRICDGVTAQDSIETNVDAAGTNLEGMFTYFGVTQIPTKIKLQFQVDNTLKGDLDGNNVVDANDASVALELYKAQNATAQDIAIGDMDNNELIDANDASLILEYYKTNN